MVRARRGRQRMRVGQGTGLGAARPPAACQRWNGVPRGTMDEVSCMPAWVDRSSYGKAAVKIVPPDPRIPGWKMLWGGGVDIASIVRCEPMELPMQTLNNLSRSLIALEPASTLIAVIEMSLSSWLVAGIVPGIERQPLKKL